MTLNSHAIHEQLIGQSYDQNMAYRAEFQDWVNPLWLEKDQELAQLINADPTKETH